MENEVIFKNHNESENALKARITKYTFDQLFDFYVSKELTISDALTAAKKATDELYFSDTVVNLDLAISSNLKK